MIDAAFDHLQSDPQHGPEPSHVDPFAETDEQVSHEPAIEELGGNPIYDTGS